MYHTDCLRRHRGYDHARSTPRMVSLACSLPLLSSQGLPESGEQKHQGPRSDHRDRVQPLEVDSKSSECLDLCTNHISTERSFFPS